MEGAAGWSHFLDGLYKDKLGFWVGIGILDGGDFFRWDLKISFLKNSGFKFQRKMIRIVIFTIFPIWSPTLTTFWYSVFVSILCMVYTPPTTRKYFFVGAKKFSCG